jgi:Protein of unknown function (DUF3048) N-terminal domain/Protein of unknown function (DUF3048) C-terminal domain
MTQTRIATTRNRNRRLLIVASGLVVTAAACTGTRAEGPATTDASTTAPTTDVSTTERATSTTRATTTTARPTPTTERRRVEVEPARMPLTGAPLRYGQRPPNRPALVAKIDNVGAARPQTGLNQADVVFEEIVEARLTRFAAVFHSQGSNPVGPIRSGRTQDVDLLSGLNQPLFLWSGGNPGVTAAIDNSDFISINHSGGGGGFYRTDRPAPHNLYNTTDAVWAQTTPEAGRPDPLFRYVMPREAPRGKLTSWLEVQVGVNPVRWDWSPQCRCYLREQYGSPHELTDGQATADNVVVLLTGYRPSYVDARSPEAITVGEGLAFVMSEGRLQIGKWQRQVNTDPVRLFTPKRQLMEIAPGRTWVELADVVDHNVRTG